MILGSGQAEYRQYMLARIADHYDIALVTTSPVTWERPFLIAHEQAAEIAPTAIRAAAAALAKRHPISGVMTYHEPFVEIASAIAQTLGVGRCDPRVLARCRDKLASREAFRRAEVPSAQAILARDLRQADEAAARIGYPVVVKPRALAASFGVSLVLDRRELAAATDCARNARLPDVLDYQGDVLIEEYLDGPEISVDSVAFRGSVQPLIYARKEVGFAPFFEEVGHVVEPAAALGDVRGAIDGVVAAAHAALGIDNAVTHTELRLTRDGPRVVELNGRSGGDLIPYLGYLAIRADVALASADVAADREPRVYAPGEHLAAPRAAGIRFLYPGQDGRVEGVGLDPGYSPQAWLDQLTWLVRPGAEVKLPPRSFYHCRLGFAVVVAETAEQCTARLDEVKRHAVSALSPLEPLAVHKD
jgi:ATP-grasp domain